MRSVSSSASESAPEGDKPVRQYRPQSGAAVETIVRFAPSGQAQTPAVVAQPVDATGKVREIGGRKDGPEPTRYGDWEKNGRCIDF
jgi:hypothetical protein